MIFFDIDDTLVTHSQSQKQAADLFWEAFADRLPYSKAEFPGVWDAVMQKHFAAFTAGKISFQDHRLRRMQEVFSAAAKPLAEDEADALFQDYLQHYEDNWALFADVLPCLRALSHFKLGIISNGNGEQQKRKLRRMGIKANFVVVAISDDLGLWKPKPEIFWEACRQASVSPQDCTYIGDSLVGDAQASQNAGMRGIWLNRHHLPCSEARVSVINSLSELAMA